MSMTNDEIRSQWVVGTSKVGNWSPGLPVSYLLGRDLDKRLAAPCTLVTGFYFTNACLHAVSVHPWVAPPRNSCATRALSREPAMFITVVYGNDSVKASKP